MTNEVELWGAGIDNRETFDSDFLLNFCFLVDLVFKINLFLLNFDVKNFFVISNF